MLRVLSGEKPSRQPVWLMRQAGRYLEEYRKLRAEAGSFMNLCFNSEMAAEVTLQPLRRFDLDAAIIFSDILVIPHALGQKLSFVEGEGPRLEKKDFSTLSYDAFDDILAPVYGTLRNTRQRLSNDKTLIGFAGAPWTVACYMIQGGGDKTFSAAKEFAKNNPADFKNLLDIVSDATARYLINQIKNGADVVQIFDSWANLCPPEKFHDWIIAPTKKIVALVRQEYPGFPIIGFPRAAVGRYEIYAAETGVSCIGVGQETNLAAFNENIVTQGNLDPEVLLAGGDNLEKSVADILQAVKNKPHIFNLGHGIIKETPVEHVTQLINQIRRAEA